MTLLMHFMAKSYVPNGGAKKVKELIDGSCVCVEGV
jgi:hypothetical protein